MPILLTFVAYYRDASGEGSFVISAASLSDAWDKAVWLHPGVYQVEAVQ